MLTHRGKHGRVQYTHVHSLALAPDVIKYLSTQHSQLLMMQAEMERLKAQLGKGEGAAV